MTWFSDFMRALKSTRPDAASPVRVKLPTLHQGEPGLTAAIGNACIVVFNWEKVDCSQVMVTLSCPGALSFHV